MMRIKTELDKLEKYLIDHRITFERVDEDAVRDETGRFLIRPARHQIYVPEEKESRWDAMCQPGSFGYETGKIEIYGSLVTEEDRDSVVGWLTADDVIKRIEAEDRRTR